MNRNQLQASREKRRAEFKQQCDDDPVQLVMCIGCNRPFDTRYEYEMHLVYRSGYYTNSGQDIDGEWQCPKDVYQEGKTA